MYFTANPVYIEATGFLKYFYISFAKPEKLMFGCAVTMALFSRRCTVFLLLLRKLSDSMMGEGLELFLFAGVRIMLYAWSKIISNFEDT